MSQILSTHLLPNFYPPAPIHIGDTRLTPREWDVLSAFYFLKKPQAIGILLRLGNKGVETHLRNIKQKLPLKNKDLTHFLDTCSSDLKESLAKHYKCLLIEDVLQETLKTLKSKLPKQMFTYQWDKSESFPANFPFVYIHNHLKLAGIHVVSNNERNDAHKSETKTLPHNIINISDPESYYTSFIDLLQSLFPQEEYKEIFQEFLKKQHDILSDKNIIPSSCPLSAVNSDPEEQLPVSNPSLYETFEHLSVPWNTPYIPEHFIQRESLKHKIMSQLQRNLQGLNIVGLYGLGGIGKTYLALDIMNHPIKQYNFRGWITSNDEKKLKADYLKLGHILHLYTKDMREEQKISMIKSWLNSQENLLLIFDNVPNMEILEKYLPTKGDIIITSRNFRLPQGIEIDVMEEEEAFELLTSLIKERPHAGQAKSLLKKLGYLPLAIAQAGAYIDQSKISIDQYLQLYDEEKTTLLATHIMPVGDSHLSVYVTWDIIFKEIQEKDKTGKAISLLRLLSFCHFINIPKSFIREYLYHSQSNSFFEKLGKLFLSFLRRFNNFSAAQVDIQMNAIIALLRQHSLIKVTPNTIAIHPLLQDCIKSSIPLKDKKVILKEGINIIKRIYPLRNEYPHDYELAKTLLPQIESILTHTKKHLTKKDLSQLDYLKLKHLKLLAYAANAYDRDGSYYTARKFLEKALALKITDLRTNYYGSCRYIDMAPLLVYLGRAHLWIGGYHTGKSLLEEALVIQEDCYNTRKHIEISFTLTALGRAQLWLGNYAEAKELFDKALVIQKSYYGNHKHINTIFTLRWLGITQFWLGNYIQAQELLERVLTLQEAFYQTRNRLEISFTLRHLGRIQLWLDNYAESKQLLEEALDIQENYHGNREHFDSSLILVDLGRAYLDLGNHDQAKTLIIKALSIQEKYYGTHQHIHIATTTKHLGIVCLRLNDFSQARTLLEGALKVQKWARDHNELEITSILTALAELEFLDNNGKKALSFINRALQVLLNYPNLNQEHKYIKSAEKIKSLILKNNHTRPEKVRKI